MKNALLNALAIASALVLGGCAAIRAGAENETDVRIVEVRDGAYPIAWIDNETILVHKNSGEQVTRKKSGTRRTVFRLVALNYRTGERRTYGQADQQICYADGYISYINEDLVTGDILAVYGELGNETVRKIKPGEIRFDRGRAGSCRPSSEMPARPPWLDDKTRFWRLWATAGLIDCRTTFVSVRERHAKARFHKLDDPVGVSLPFSCYEVFRGFRYYAFKAAYFSLEFDFRAPWPEGRNRRAFWLYPDGHVETIVLPYSYAIRESGVPTARGIVAFAAPTKRGEDYWVYLITPEGAKTIVRGNAMGGVTSPDGCKVAMLLDPEFDARIDHLPVTTNVTLKVLELCKG